MKRFLSLAMAALLVVGLIGTTAFAATPAGCPEDGTGMDSVWGYKQMELGRKITEYGEQTGWEGHVSSPQGFSNYEKFSGTISLRNHTNVDDSHWWQLEFTLTDDTFIAILKLFYYSGKGTQGQVETEENLGSGNTDEYVMKAIVDSAAQKVASSTMPTYPSTSDIIAALSTSTVYVNGQPIMFDAYNINDNNYFKLRDIAYALNGTAKQFEVAWDGAANAILLTSGTPYTIVGGEMVGRGDGFKYPVPTDSKIFLNSQDVQLTAYNIDGNNYFKLRDVGAALDFGVDWDGVNNAIVIDTNKGYDK